ncbi:MAG: hypothetical protein R3Y28_01175 [Candidatus Gastranaerophilales bacterium]
MDRYLIDKLTRAKNNKIIFLLLFVFMVSICASGCSQEDFLNQLSNQTVTKKNTQVNEFDDEGIHRDNVKVGDDGMNAAIAGDEVNQADDANQTGAMISYYLRDSGRDNPFVPFGLGSDGDNEVSLLPPPQSITEDSDAVEVIKTKVSGIMYDDKRPSAIVNFDNTDHLVRIGDIINNYKILAIDNNHVTVQLGTNVYKAGVGELFSDDAINFNNVSNLENKFGSSSNRTNNEF